MKHSPLDMIETFLERIPSATYVLEESRLRNNLELIRSVADRAGVEIILAFKAYALWKTFPIFREYIRSSTASSLNEARLAVEEMGALAHTYSPAYTERDFAKILKLSSHVTFNSVSQLRRFVREDGKLTSGDQTTVSFGLRVNPEYSVVEQDIYNPALPGSRFGVTSEELGGQLPPGIEGLHFHSLCESNSYDFERMLHRVEERFSSQLARIKWLNCGGGHLMTHADYDVEHLIATLRAFRERHPHIKVILEPGSAFAWQTGFLRSEVVDIVEHHGIKTAIVDVSFTCHMPDTLEMPYKPAIRGGVPDSTAGEATYRIGGASCLSGDFIGEWRFAKPLKVGDPIIFEDMLHYTTVKTTMFNGVNHPSIALLKLDGTLSILREYTYEDYKNRMD